MFTEAYIALKEENYTLKKIISLTESSNRKEMQYIEIIRSKNNEIIKLNSQLQKAEEKNDEETSKKQNEIEDLKMILNGLRDKEILNQQKLYKYESEFVEL